MSNSALAELLVLASNDNYNAYPEQFYVHFTEQSK